MSQAKVDKYKEYKKNRKEILEKEKKQMKRGKILGTSVIALLCVAIVTLIGAKAYTTYQEELASRPDYKVTYFALADYAGIVADETEAEE